MDAKLQRRVQRYGWDKAASHYERSWQSQLEPAQSALLELAGLKPGIEVLDVACGTGLVSLKAAAGIVPGGRIVRHGHLGADGSRGAKYGRQQADRKCSFRAHGGGAIEFRRQLI